MMLDSKDLEIQVQFWIDCNIASRARSMHYYNGRIEQLKDLLKWLEEKHGRGGVCTGIDAAFGAQESGESGADTCPF